MSICGSFPPSVTGCCARAHLQSLWGVRLTWHSSPAPIDCNLPMPEPVLAKKTASGIASRGGGGGVGEGDDGWDGGDRGDGDGDGGDGDDRGGGEGGDGDGPPAE
jgi:hypothetical protein